MSDLERYTITMPHELFEAFDKRNALKGYRNRSEAVRDLVREALIKDEWANPDEHVAATITLVYDHHTRALSDKITEVQHDCGEMIISTLHVHLDHHNCMEVIVLRGVARQIRAAADTLSCIKGVKHAQLTLTTDGKGIA